MGSWKRIMAITGIGAAVAGIVWFSKRAMNLTNTKAELDTVINPRVHSIDLKGIVVRVDVKVKNPKKTGFTMTFPYVKILYGDSVVGSSNAVDKKIAIPGYGEAMVEAIMIQITPLSLLGTAFNLLKEVVMQGKTALFKAVVTSDVQIANNITYPYRDETTFQVKPKTAAATKNKKPNTKKSNSKTA